MAPTNDTSALRRLNSATPATIPLRSWLQIAKRVSQELGKDNVQIVSAGIAFYFFLSLFPAIAAFLLLYGLFMNPTEAALQIQQFEPLLPAEAYKLIANFVDGLTENTNSKAGRGLALSIALSVFSANKGTAALFNGLNIAYNLTDSRSFIPRTILTLTVTFGTIVAGSILLALVAVVPAVVKTFPLSGITETLFELLRWPLIVVVGFVILGVLYKLAPNRPNPRWQWVTPGSIVAIFLWILGSAGFSWYIESFGNMAKTYGSLAAIVALMLWFFIFAYAILLGAEINAETEKQIMLDAVPSPGKHVEVSQA